MTFLSPQFFCFFPITALAYFLLPRRVKNLWLLLASWFFYLCAKPMYLAFLLFAILTSYFAGRLLEKQERRNRKTIAALTLLLVFGVLFILKYLSFALSIAGQAVNALGFDYSAPALDLLLPLGISFYFFQAMGYVIDVYRGNMEAEHDILLYALFLSFFPQLLSGPIGRSGHLLPQFRTPHLFDYDQFRTGLVRFLWGVFKKLVLADRLAVLVNTVFAAPDEFGALQLIGAAVAFSLQIYCDFSAYSDLALGTARMMGFSLTENFHTPYFSRSIAEFWRRWHMSLSHWFRDYLYFPLGGSRKGALRKYLNVLVVFTVSGLWHGAAMTFVIWGLLNGLYQVIGGLTKPLRDRIRHRLRLSDNGRLTTLMQIGITFVLSTAAWVFFKADSLSAAMAVFQGMFTGPLWVFTSMGLDRWELLAACGGLLVLFLVDLWSVKHDLLSDYLSARRPVRWLALWCLLFAALIFGSYGAGYDAQSFIYFKF